jgi:hypothetical protein
MVPVTVEAPKETLGHTDTATTTAASRNPFTRPRMPGSLLCSSFIVYARGLRVAAESFAQAQRE